MVKYPAIFFEDGEYIGVEFPDLPGCFSQADDLPRAKTAATKALRCYLDDVDAKDYPQPSEMPDATEIEMSADLDESHTKLYNDETKRTVVIPMDVEILGEKLRQKILQAAALRYAN